MTFGDVFIHFINGEKITRKAWNGVPRYICVYKKQILIGSNSGDPYGTFKQEDLLADDWELYNEIPELLEGEKEKLASILNMFFQHSENVQIMKFKSLYKIYEYHFQDIDAVDYKFRIESPHDFLPSLKTQKVYTFENTIKERIKN